MGRDLNCKGTNKGKSDSVGNCTLSDDLSFCTTLERSCNRPNDCKTKRQCWGQKHYEEGRGWRRANIRYLRSIYSWVLHHHQKGLGLGINRWQIFYQSPSSETGKRKSVKLARRMGNEAWKLGNWYISMRNQWRPTSTYHWRQSREFLP